MLLGAAVLSLPVLSSFNPVPRVLVTPTIKLFSLLLHSYNFATVTNHSVNTCGDRGLPKGAVTHRLRTTDLGAGRLHSGSQFQRDFSEYQGRCSSVARHWDWQRQLSRVQAGGSEQGM